MTYNPNIPLSTDLISNSQAALESNFQAIDSGTTGSGEGFSRNHVTMTDGTSGGLHYRVDYYQAQSSPTISGFVSSAYPKTVTVTTPSSSNTELFYKNSSADTQMTSSALTASSGEGFIPGGLLVKANASAILNGNSTQAITFTTQFPTSCISVVVTPVTSLTLLEISVAQTQTGFTVGRSGTVGVCSFNWIAIGY